MSSFQVCDVDHRVLQVAVSAHQLLLIQKRFLAQSALCHECVFMQELGDGSVEFIKSGEATVVPVAWWVYSKTVEFRVIVV